MRLKPWLITVGVFLAVGITVYGVIGYVLVHFIKKFW